MSQSFKLPDLPYDYSALEPVISAEIMELHHKKHHQGYVTKLNEAMEKYETLESKGDVAGMIALQSAIKFNGGGHVNHSLFWTMLAPEGSSNLEKGALSQAIDDAFGSFEKFKEKFNTKTAAIQGSGWGWLGYCGETDSLKIATCSNQDPLSTQGLVPIFGVDVWEHAYYLQYKNVRPDYLKNIWRIVNWVDVENRYKQASG
ncbi:MAG: superoxide dismutase [Chlamydiales bacterium]|nr:superoxide dismutase [Chlamydiales bacterium]